MTKIPVYLKLKPCLSLVDWTISQNDDRPNSVDLQLKPGTKDKASYTFDKVFDPQSDSRDIYSAVLQPAIKPLVESQVDSTFFTLGPSASGKTHSVLGDKSADGILSYALKGVFEQTESASSPGDNVATYHEILGSYYGGLLLNGSDIVEDPKKSAPRKQSTNSLQKVPTSSLNKLIVSINTYEIYNDTIIDLLELNKDYGFLKKQLKKQTLNSTEISTNAKDGKVRPTNIFTISVTSYDQAKLLIDSALKNRHSRTAKSHLFVVINVHSVTFKDHSKSAVKSSFGSSQHKVLTHEAFPGKQIKIKTSRLTIADLASSERKRTHVPSSRTPDTNFANQSIFELGRILNILSKSKNKTREKSLIRTDKLTRLLLADYIANADNKLMVLVNFNPQADINTILSTLRLISPLPKFKNYSADTKASLNRMSTFTFRLNFKSKDHKHPVSWYSNESSQNSSGANSPASSISIASSRLSNPPISEEPAEPSSIAVRRLSMVPKTPPSPITVRSKNAPTYKKRSTSPLIESFTASETKRAGRALSSPAATRHKSSVSTSLNVSFEENRNKGKNGSWGSVTTVGSLPHAVESYITSLGINIANSSDAQILEKIVLRSQSLSDENSFLKLRNQMLEGQINGLNNDQSLKLTIEGVKNQHLAHVDRLNQAHQKQTEELETSIKSFERENQELNKHNKEAMELKEINSQLIGELHNKLVTQDKQMLEVQGQLRHANAENALLDKELKATSLDLEQIKQKFTVLAFQNKEKTQQLDQYKALLVHSSSRKGSDETEDLVELDKKLNTKLERGKISSFYFGDFSFDTTIDIEKEMGEVNLGQVDIERADIEGSLSEPFLNITDTENLTSNSSAIFEDTNNFNDKHNPHSLSNSHYDESDPNRDCNLSPRSMVSEETNTSEKPFSK